MLRQFIAKYLGRSGEFFIEDFLILFFLILRVHVLPGELSNKEIDDHIDHSFKIVPPTLLYPQMGVNRSIPCSAGKILVVFVGDVHAIHLILLCQPEINHKDSVTFLILTN